MKNATGNPSKRMYEICRVLWPIGILLLVAVVFLGSSDSTKTAGIRSGDLFDFYLPCADYVGRAIRNGRIPLWNPEVGCGVDILSNPASLVLYPPNWIHALVSFRVGAAMLTILHLLLAGFGLFGWFRTIAIRPGPALLGVAALLFGAIGESWWPPLFFTLAWTPVELLIIDLPGAFSRWRWVGLATCFALQLLAGCAQYFTYCAILVMAYVGIRALKDRKPPLLLHCASALVLAVAIATVQLIPTYKYLTETWRSLSSLDPDRVHYLWGGVPKEGKVSQLYRIIPKIVVNDERDRVLEDRFSYGYLGIVVPVAVMVALLRRRTWRILFFFITMVAGLYLCMGFSPGLLPVYEAFSRFPVVGVFRTPDRLLIWYLFGASFLTAAGAERIWPSSSEQGGRRLIVGICVLLVVLRLAILWRIGVDSWLNLLIWLSGIAVIGSTGGLIAKQPGRKWSSRIPVMWIVFLITLIDLWNSCAFVCPYIYFPRENFSEISYHGEKIMSKKDISDLNQVVEDENLYRWYICERYRPVMRTDMLPPQHRTLPYYNPLSSERHVKLMRQLRLGIHFTLWDISADRHLRLFDKCSIKAIVTPNEIENAQSQGWEKVRRLSLGRYVYINQRVIPRVMLYSKYETVLPEEAFQHLVSEGAQDANRLLLEDCPSEGWLNQHGQNGQSASKHSSEEIQFKIDEPERMLLRVSCRNPRLLLVTDSYAPGWTCYVDGKPVRIMRANYLHRAIELFPGEHLIEFRYLPDGLKLGTSVSAIGVGVLIMVALVGLFRRV